MVKDTLLLVFLEIVGKVFYGILCEIFCRIDKNNAENNQKVIIKRKKGSWKYMCISILATVHFMYHYETNPNCGWCLEIVMVIVAATSYLFACAYGQVFLKENEEHIVVRNFFGEVDYIYFEDIEYACFESGFLRIYENGKCICNFPVEAEEFHLKHMLRKHGVNI